MAGSSKRNPRFIDRWSAMHLVAGVLLGWVMDPFWALIVLIAWEPLELFVLSPLVWRSTGREFGHESLRNSWSDILFDAAGVVAGGFLLRPVLAPPFLVFGG